MTDKINMRTSVRKGFSLIEIIVVLAIVSVMLLITNSGGEKPRESQIGAKGRMWLKTIYNAEKRYRLDNNGVYLISSDPAVLSTGLGIKIPIDEGTRKVEFKYTVIAYNAQGMTNGFKVVAKRSPNPSTGAGMCNAREMFLASDGSEDMINGKPTICPPCW